ncbi:MAG TPA: NAD(P)/FAD-dependent oxidoreductase [Ruminiclostridium sp.]|nr:NAD(P)/FAD-dependent oxidoreductase [Ruminiclostridium sp.]
MHDAIIIGRGPAGMSAALYTVRANLKTLVVGRRDSALSRAGKIDNYFGFAETVSGSYLLDEGERQISRLGAELVEDEVISVEKGDFFNVKTTSGEYTSKTLLFATGQPQKKVPVENLDEFEGKGVSYCTTCDGFFYNNLKVGVLGFRDFAIHEAVELLTFTKNITIYTNGKELELSEESKQIADSFKVNTRPVQKLDGSEFLQRIHFKDGTSEEIDGIFVAYGSASSADFARKLGVIVDGSSIVVDRKQQTNIDGAFAAGDCTGVFKQVSIAVGQGALAGRSMIEYARSL